MIICASSMPAPRKWRIRNNLTSSSLPSNHDYPTEYHTIKYGSLKKQQFEEIRHVLRQVGEDTLECLPLIDALQRLGMDHHFREEIEAALYCQYKRERKRINSQDELYEISTRFRLLRQEGYKVNPDVLGKFMNKEWKLNSEVSRDIKGLMGLYEASQLSIEGEDILDELGEYSSQVLNMWMGNLDHRQARIVNTTLRHPYHKSLSMFMAKIYIRDHKYQNRWINILKEAAEMEFSFIRAMQREEIFKVSKWLKETGLAKELKFARNQPLKWYMFPAVALPDPILSEERVELTKPISFIYVIDDIYDVYGTLDELTLFTEAVNRWDFAAIEQLPDCMKYCFKALDNMTNEISHKIYKKHGFNPVVSLRRTWAYLCDAFLIEAKWFAFGQLPSADEYLKNGIISSGMHIVLIHMFFLLGHRVNNESINLVTKNPNIITSAASILRLWDDLGSAKDENQDGNDGSFVECYMKDSGCSEETALQKVAELILDSWKRLNKETLFATTFSATFRKGCLNMARMIPLMYSYDENGSLPILDEYMKSIMYEGADP